MSDYLLEGSTEDGDDELIELVESRLPGLMQRISDDDICAECRHLINRSGFFSICRKSVDDERFPGVKDAGGYVKNCVFFKQKA